MKLEDHCFNAAPPGQRDAVSCVTLSMAIAAIEQARRNGAVEARNELLGGISLAKTPLTLDECIIMYRDAVRRMRQAEAKAEQARAECERLTKDRDEWAAKWRETHKQLAELKFPGMTGVVKANDAARKEGT